MTKQIMVIISLLAITLLFSACRPAPTNQPPPQADGGHYYPIIPPNMTRCPEARPQMCTREYRPVCGSTIVTPDCSPGRPCPAIIGYKKVTYSNACTACSNDKVRGHTPGACPG